MEKRSGLFIEKLKNKVSNYDIPFVGINRKYINKSYNELKMILDSVQCR